MWAADRAAGGWARAASAIGAPRAAARWAAQWPASCVSRKRSYPAAALMPRRVPKTRVVKDGSSNLAPNNLTPKLLDQIALLAAGCIRGTPHVATLDPAAPATFGPARLHLRALALRPRLWKHVQVRKRVEVS